MITSIHTLLCSSPLRCGWCVCVHQHLQTSLSPAAASGANGLHDKNSRQGDIPHLLHNGSRLCCQHLLPGNHGGGMQRLIESLWEVYMTPLVWMNSSAALSRQPDKHKLNVSRSYCALHLTDTQIPAVHDFGLFMALIVSCSWLWVSVLMPAALYIWTQHVEPHEHAWLNWWAVISLILCEIVFLQLRSLQLSLTLNSLLSEAWSCFWACRRATVLCQMRMMMWHFCRWRWSQVRLFSPLAVDGKGMSPGFKTWLFRHH